MSASAKKYFTPEMITAISAIFIGVCAIAVSLYETSLIRTQQKGSVWPHVELAYTYNEAGFKLLLANTGIGPAKIEYMEIAVDGKTIQDWDELFEALDIPIGRYTVSYVRRRVLAPGATIEALELQASAAADALYREIRRIDWKLCYASVYDDCWEAEMGVGTHKRKRCPSDEEREFLN